MNKVGNREHADTGGVHTRRAFASAVWVVGVFSCCVAGFAVDVEDVRQLLVSGQYAKAVQIAGDQCKEKEYSEQWPLLLLEGLQALGRYEESYRVLTNQLARDSRSIRLRWIGREVCQALGRTEESNKLLVEIVDLVANRPWAYRDTSDVIVFGRALLALGTDPKLVLNRVYEVAKKTDPGARDPYLAIGELALEKHDFSLAARVFQEGLAKIQKDADLHYGLARAYETSDSAQMLKAIESALALNSNHVPSILLLADRAIDAEDYSGAEELLNRARAVNPVHSEAWAYSAVIARLQNRHDLEQKAIAESLRLWSTNPRVPHLIGRKLSQKYRFAEGAEFQKRALQFDPRFLPAKAQLAEDLLRLGEEDEGWALAREVQNADGYNVTALNLVTLRETLDSFALLTNAHFVLRMPAEEARVYGTRVLELLEEAHGKLCSKYGVELSKPVKVEIFSHQSDFAVRTFGLPENQGFLGVCFGPVITANSPTARPGRAFNWEAMLWHEFCHAVTLHLTSNRMPRWLSEGLSVYEERLANPAWGEKMNPQYKQMILGGELVRLSHLSRAFISPKSPLHLQFAYFESSLVVEFLVRRFGFESVLAMLRDIGEGADMISAMAKRTAPAETLERDFQEFAMSCALKYCPGLDFRKPPADVLHGGPESDQWQEWVRENSTNYWALMQTARNAIQMNQWAEAKRVLKSLVDHSPDEGDVDGPMALLAEVHRALGETTDERNILERLAKVNPSATRIYSRLMELGTAAQDWEAVIDNARRYIAVNPMVALPYRFMAEAAEKCGNTSAAIQALRALLELDPLNPAETRFRLARQLWRAGNPDARGELLRALEEAPRHKNALALLIEMRSTSTNHNQQGTPTPTQIQRWK